MNNERILNKIKSAYYGAIIGDAYGVPYEFLNKDEIKYNDIHMKGYGTHYKPIGTWSDDTSMMLCLMKWLSENKNISDIDYPQYSKLKEYWNMWYGQGYLTPFSECFDIGNQTMKALDSSELFGKISLDNTAQGNGALMRILPFTFLHYFGYFAEKDLIKTIMHNTNMITHGSVVSQVFCSKYVDLVIELIDNSEKQDRFDLINILKKELSDDYVPKSSGWIVDTYNAAVWSVIDAASNETNPYKIYEKSIKNAISLGNDTDTTAIVTGGIVGSFFDECIPSSLYNKLVAKEMLEDILNEFTGVFIK